MTSAPDVLLLHGVGLDSGMWSRVAPKLAETGHTVHTPDLLGHGAAPPAPTGTTLADLAAPVGESVNAASSPTHLVGFSLGALVATRVALDHPGRVASLTLISGVANRSAAERRAVRDRLQAARDDLTATFDAAIRRWFTPRWRADEPDLVSSVRNTLAANDPGSYLACYAVFAEADAQLWTELPELAAPVVAVTGEHDPGSTARMSAAVADRVPQGQWAAVVGARHLLPLQRPDAVIATVLNQTRGHSLDIPGALIP